MLNKSEAIKKFKRFINSIDNKDIIAVLPDTDVDGFSSGVLVYKGLEKIKGRKPDILQFQHVRNCFTDDSIEYFKKRGVTKIIVTDQAYDQIPEQIKEVEDFADILIIDHHQFYNDVNSNKTTLIKATMLNKKIDGSQYCASKMVYDLFSEIVDMSEFKWIAALGILSDMNTETYLEFIKDVLKKYKIRYRKNLFKTEFGRAAEILSSANAVSPPKFQQSFEILYTAQNIYDILDSKLAKLWKRVYEEVEYYVNNYQEFAEEYPEFNLIFIETKTQFRINSILINILSNEKFPEKIFVIYSEPNNHGYIKVSARNQLAGKNKKGIKVNAMLEYAVKDLEDAVAGGHMPAAGASIKKEDLNIFKKRIIEFVKKKNGI